MKIGIIGGGKMGEALASSLIRAEAVSAPDICIAEIVPERRDYLVGKLGVQVGVLAREAVPGADVVVLAVKPQEITQLGLDLHGALKPEQIVVSILAGVRLEKLESALNHKKLIRAMPNTPGRIGQGITVWKSTEYVTDEELDLAATVLQAFGPEVLVHHEEMLDMATAMSGSGPAYVFLFAEAFVDAGVRIGLPRPLAQHLAYQTISGSMDYLQQSGKHPAELRNEVTSPAGTTAAGLHELERNGLRTAMNDAIEAAFRRSVELGG